MGSCLEYCECPQEGGVNITSGEDEHVQGMQFITWLCSLFYGHNHYIISIIIMIYWTLSLNMTRMEIQSLC